jgi:predicted Zn-dependent peptidase
MNKALKYIFGISFAIMFGLACNSSKISKTKDSTSSLQETSAVSKPIPSKVYTYESVANDPLNARIYTLSNGFKAYLTVYKDAPRIHTYLATKAGSKNDPYDATGLAHYLEHMLFKGTDKFGTLDYAREKQELDKIESLYEQYRATKDISLRKSIYHQIDSISGVAAKYAIANEYDKMIAAIGSKGNNAFTDFERTVYINDIPSNQLENWLHIEAERFRHPVLRIFHTELEAVYEEKNKSLDNDDNKTFEALFSNLFKKHTYGTQTTIGTVEHLKNPSLLKIKEYYNKYYVPNNMALILSGDFNPDEAIKLIDAKFGSLPSQPVPEYVPAVEEPILEPRTIEVVGPDAEYSIMAYRLGGNKTEDASMGLLLSKLLSNGTAGLLDLNINQQQKAMNAFAFTEIFNDYSMLMFGASPKEEQSLEQVKSVLLGQIEKIKKGDFPNWLLEAVVTDAKVMQTQAFSTNKGRADKLLNAFTSGLDYQINVNQVNNLAKITKEQVVEFANKNLQNNYVHVKKLTGEDKTSEKVEKPQITPVELNRNSQSSFSQNLLATKVTEIEPVFIDYEKDIEKLMLANKIPVLYKKNSENNTFSMYFIFDMGTNHNPKLGIALEYLNFLGTSRLSPAKVKEEFYRFGCTFEVFVSENQLYVSLSGLAENFEKDLISLENLLADAQPNPEALAEQIEDQLKKRVDAKLSKTDILQKAMFNYAKYGSKSPFSNVLSEKELRKTTAIELVSLIKSLTQYEHRILYYGPLNSSELTEILNNDHNSPKEHKSITAPLKYTEQETTETKVYVVDYEMKQAEILALSKGDVYTKENASKIALFNEYFGGGMGSIVFQTMRESKALAYGVYAIYTNPERANEAHYLRSYIGTQVDKLPEAMKGMEELMNNIPKADNLFEASKKSVIQKIRSERITKELVLFSYEKAKKLGLNYDIRKDVFEQVPKMEFSDLEAFSKKYVNSKKYNIMVLGSKDELDLKTLKNYGPLNFLNLEELFGY